MTFSGRRGWWFSQLPNAITLTRILLAPIVVWLLLAHWQTNVGRILALAAFVLSAATDGVDGGLARKYQLESNFGKLLDPIADKLLLGGTMVSLSIVGSVPWVATILILGRELLITLFRLAVARKTVIAASGGGKFKTVLQIVAVSLVILPIDSVWAPWTSVALAPIWAAVAVTIITGVQYVRAYSSTTERL